MHFRLLLASLVLSTGLTVALTSCEDDDGVPATCRFEPQRCPGGNPGAFCDGDRDCAPGAVCCDDDNNCRGGMCTYECDDDRDCPSDMRCEHDVCFYACDGDEDCAEDMSCEHGNTVCEWD